MHFLELTEIWAKENGWWTWLCGPVEDGYLHIAKYDPFITSESLIEPPRVFTLWANGAWDLNGEYPTDDKQRLEPADPDFFLNLKYLVVTNVS